VVQDLTERGKTMSMENLEIGLFIIVGTGLIMGFFVGLAIWLERSFKK
jgi:hypothetical protein